MNVKINIALSRDNVHILIKISVRDHWAFVFRRGEIDNQTYKLNLELCRSVFIFKAMVLQPNKYGVPMDSEQKNMYNIYEG